MGTECHFIGFFGQRWIFRIDIFHDHSDFLGVDLFEMVEPDDPAMYSTVITEGPYFLRD